MVTSQHVKQCDMYGLAAIIGISTAAWFLGVAPWFESRRDHDALQVRLTAAGKEFTQLAEMSHGLDSQLEDMTAALDRLEVKLEPFSGLNRRLAAVIGAASSVNLEVLELRPDEPIMGERFGTVPIIMKLGGPFTGSAALLELLNRDYKDLSVRGFKLHRQHIGEEPVTFLDLDLVWYVLKEE